MTKHCALRAGWTALHYAARFDHTSSVCKLLEAGADVNALNMRGHTPLDWAKETNATGATGMLVAAGGVASLVEGQSVWDTYCNDDSEGEVAEDGQGVENTCGVGQRTGHRRNDFRDLIQGNMDEWVDQVRKITEMEDYVDEALQTETVSCS